MNNTDLEYNRLLNIILDSGKRKKNRTGVDTIGVFGAQARFNLAEGFPILTTKKVFTKGIIHELLWFLRGETNIKYLVDNDVHIWDGDAYRNYKTKFEKEGWAILKGSEKAGVLDSYTENGETFTARSARPHTKEEYIARIKSDGEFARTWGDLGQGTYGQMWREFPYAHLSPGHQHELYRVELKTVDQLQKVLDKLKSNPDDRRMIVSAWHPYFVDHCALPPCHCMFHFNTEELDIYDRWNLLDTYNKNPDGSPKDLFKLTDIETNPDGFMRSCDDIGMPRRRLNVLLYQRSCDTFLGVPFNITSYSLLLAMVAQVSNMVAGEFIHTYGDLHIYENHLTQVEEQLSREPKTLPKLVLNPNVTDLFKFKYEDIKIEGYDPHPAIKGEVSTG